MATNSRIILAMTVVTAAALFALSGCGDVPSVPVQGAAETPRFTSAAASRPAPPPTVLPEPPADTAARPDPAAPDAAPALPDAGRELIAPPPRVLLTKLRGELAVRREYDLWLIRSVSNILNKESRQEKILAYCMSTVKGVEHILDSKPDMEYALQADGSVLVTSGKPPKTLEQQFRDGQRMQTELETGIGGPVVQDCAGSLVWFGTWHDKTMPTDEKLKESASKARVDMDEIDSTLDPRLVESLPRPQAP